jgi:secreted PhoX family phosphatase
MTRHSFTTTRRSLLRGAAATALAAPLAGLFGRRAAALARLEPVPSPYGPLAPAMDQTTGLPLLQLPEGFTYQSFGWSGDLMADGRPNPTRHDGMAVVRARLAGGTPEITLIRNHEATVDPRYGTIEAAGFYDRGAELIGEDDDDNEITGPAAGGTTTLVFADGKFTSVAPSLGGTWNNCAGGPTPWGTWLSGEEDKSDFTEVGGQPHGYMFEVSPDGDTSGVPIKAMGRMDHEAAGIDPITGAVYLTEDDRNQSGFYKFVPANLDGRLGSLEQGGTLYMAKVAGTEKADLLSPSMGEQHRIEWVEIADPDLAPQPFTEAPFDADNTASGPFVQGRDLGGLRMSRLEGIHYSWRDRVFYIVDTSSGTDMDPESEDFGAIGRGDGSVWAYDPAEETLTCLFQSENPVAGNNFDNVTVSPRGGVLLCEDGGGVEDAFGMGERLMGLTPAGETYIFAKNNVQLTAAEVQAAGKSAEFVAEGDYRDTEWAGATFDPSGQWLFVNMQSPGITFAITGPWERGLL